MITGHNSIILIGPMKAGKTTVGKLLAKEVTCPFVSLDSHDTRYMQAVGFDPSNTSYDYSRSYFDEAVVTYLVMKNSYNIDFSKSDSICNRRIKPRVVYKRDIADHGSVRYSRVAESNR